MRIKEEHDFSKLLGRIKEKGYTQEALASVISRNPCTLSQKINNKGIFNATEIAAICEFLGIGTAEIGEYFFNSKVKKLGICESAGSLKKEA